MPGSSSATMRYPQRTARSARPLVTHSLPLALSLRGPFLCAITTCSFAVNANLSVRSYKYFLFSPLEIISLTTPNTGYAAMPRSRAIVLVLFGALCMSFAALFVRGLETTDGRQILTYRGFSQGAMVALIACVIRGTSLKTFLASFDKTDWAAGVAMACAFSLYIYSLLNTSVASTLLILSIAPVFAAILGWFWIGEKPTTITWLSIALALCGVAVMVGAGFDLGRTTGNLFAIGSALSFALMLVLARGSGKSDLLGGNFLGAVLAMLVMSILAYIGSDANGLAVSPRDLVILLSMGAFTIGLGIAFVAWAAPNLPSAEVSLLILLESVLSPLWVWLILGEKMSLYEITGGTMLLASVALLVAMQKEAK